MSIKDKQKQVYICKDKSNNKNILTNHEPLKSVTSDK